ncbi:MAG TPA: ABC transporter ATP-binding protein [Roseiarcus sp.]|jgi:iron(III) transport system ATP-binding protein
MARLSVKGLTKAFAATPVLRGVDLEVAPGSLVAVLGASGSGKTTLLRLLSGFERADSGSIEIDGQMVSGPGVHVAPEKRRIGYVAQEGSLFPHLSVADNVDFGLPRAERRNRPRVETLLASVDLPASYASRAPHQLSGGEQQRVALARALAPAPKLVLLDEPFSALDAALRVETRQAVSAALAASGATALLVTHDQAEALAMGLEVAVLRGGVLGQIAAPEMLYRQPVDIAMARFVGEAVILPGTVKAGAAICALGRLPLAGSAPDGSASVMVRPEQIRFLSKPDGDAPRARVLAVTFYGHDASVLLELEARATKVMSLVPGYRAPRSGDDVWLTVEGAVMAYPRADRDAGREPSASTHARLPVEPLSVAALGIKEDLS